MKRVPRNELVWSYTSEDDSLLTRSILDYDTVVTLHVCMGSGGIELVNYD